MANKKNPLTFKEYQTLSYMAAKGYTSDAQELMDHVLGLVATVGWMADNIKTCSSDHYIDTQGFKEEVSDALWYLSALCTATGLNLDEIAEGNLNKLVGKYPPKGKES